MSLVVPGPNAFLDLSDTPKTYVGQTTKVPTVNGTETGLIFGTGGGGGATTFTQLTDVPASYAGAALQGVRVNAGQTGLEFFTLGGGTGTVTSVGSADASVTITNPTTVPDLSVVKSPKLTTARTIAMTGDVVWTSPAFDGTGNVTAAGAIQAGVVALSMMANVATATVFYRKTAGAGAPEVQTLATLKTDLGLSGTNTGDQTITLTSDVTGSGTGSFATTIANNAVTNAKAAQMPTLTIKGNNTGGTANALDLTAAQTKTLLAIANTDVSGLGTLSTQNGTFTAIPESNVTNLVTDLAGKVGTTLTISTTAPLSGGGDLSTNRTLTTSMNTNKLIGRGTAGTGVMEEITLGTGLSFTGTTLNASGSGGTITTQDEGSTLSTTVTTLNFVGAGVTASGAGATTTVTIAGGGGSTDYTLWVLRGGFY